MLRFNDNFGEVLAGTIITSALVIALPSTAQALTGRQVNDIARGITVLITTETGHGSGAIIARDGNDYYVLTARHVVQYEDNYRLITHDKQAYEIDYSTVQSLPNGVDLAVLKFTSQANYPIATLGPAERSEGQDVFVSGWPAPGGTGQTIRQFSDGRISGFLDTPIVGYEISYTNVTRRGMSGGPVLDAGGRLIAIHGLGDSESLEAFSGVEGLDSHSVTSLAQLIKPGFNYAIPIDRYLQLAPQAGVYLNVQVDSSLAPELGEIYVAGEPDERDTINNVSDTLNTINDAVNTFRGVCSLFGC